jgi:hypothetical protein
MSKHKEKETLVKESIVEKAPVIHQRWVVSSRSIILVMAVALLVAFQLLIVRPLELRISHLETFGVNKGSASSPVSLEQTITDTITERKKQNALKNQMTEDIETVYTYDDFEW